MSELLPCPFCGNDPIEDRIEPHKHFLVDMPDYPGAFSIECVHCEYQIFDHESREFALKKWNCRVDLSPLRPKQSAADKAEIERLRGEVAGLRKDKERLDSGEIVLGISGEWGRNDCHFKGQDLRAAIDAAIEGERK